ncbi:MAG: deoxyribose-phosphate aldolase [Lachnospiraceae bacterium]|nr:deoxyribose-phosphate aldolase [Lachnospiraceae bacterium]MDD6191455.1 deoxyribose-phosphate aldolase [Lachnospiraceae bacterium]MDY4793682.1 deoxyribose-phosphate aldolase [Pararoseburia sp.]
MDEKTIEQILSRVDHTLLRVDSTWPEIKVILDDAMEHHTASACIPASFVKQAADYVEGKLPICTVIGFPNGYSTTATKCFETIDAVANGASEIDMVINVGWAKEGRFADILQEINQVKDACKGRLLKVIIETCLLTEEEIVELCHVVSKSKADYIKTSTGFSTAGATVSDIEIMAREVSEGTKIKAAGGIASLEDAKTFLDKGADRLGTSRVVAAVKNVK